MKNFIYSLVSAMMSFVCFAIAREYASLLALIACVISACVFAHYFSKE